MSTSIFSIIVGIVGAAKLLQAIARDEILPGLKIFGNGDKETDDPKEAIILTWIICQLFLFADLNQIATLITMAFLMTFIVTNMSCALLKMGSAPNFRPIVDEPVPETGEDRDQRSSDGPTGEVCAEDQVDGVDPGVGGLESVELEYCSCEGVPATRHSDGRERWRGEAVH
ncbi:hypothetical protein PMKS-000637 [Pichia membranifaciens]|uniref:Uncharacterized protein n=1 Tax=Pichia membranifaciens TaxID=4926 RepID=A0A1Q2YCA7_9ASCO|nr:hypothetical protein PMKS-000637 [Pichia membranifaciens]